VKATPDYRFGPFRVDLRTGILWKGEEPVGLTPKASELLVLLVREGERGLTKTELLERLWPDAVVLENNLTVAISALRKALGESAAAPRYVQTLPRRGYRFVPGALDAGVRSSPPEARTPAEAAPFVGRERELAQLTRRLAGASSGHGRVVCVTGPPGIGKTYLVERFLDRAASDDPSLLLAKGRSLEQFGPREAYLPFLDALGELLSGAEGERVRAALRTFAPTWCQHFPGVFGAEASGSELRRETVGATRERMLREFVDALGALARDSTLVLSLEDLHWGDPSSIDLLRLLCQRCRDRALLVLASFRNVEATLHNSPLAEFRKELAGREIDELALSPLAPAEVQTYLTVRFGTGRFPDALPDVLYTRTEGHPLFLTRLVSLFVERGDMSETPAGWTLTRALGDVELLLPSDVRGTLLRQLELLEPEDLRALSFASVVGPQFSSSAVATLLEVDELSLEERLDALCRVHQLIGSAGSEQTDAGLSVRYRFSHVIYQDLLYEGLSARRRAQLHLKLAEFLLSGGESESPQPLPIAVHFERGGDARRAVEFFEKAGRAAHSLLAYREARAHFTRALELLDTSAFPELAARIHLARGWVDFDAGESDGGEKDFRSCADRARAARNTLLECHGLFAASVTLRCAFRLEPSFELDRQLHQVARASGDPECLARALLNLACGAAIRANLDESFEFNRSARALLEPGFNADISAGLFGNAGGCHVLRSDYARALEQFEQALELWLDISGVVAFDTCITLGHILGNLGRLTDALAQFARAEELSRRNGQEFRYRQKPSGEGWVLRELGAVEAALDLDRRAVARARDAGARFSELSHSIDLAQDHLAAGELESAVSALARAGELLSDPDLEALPYDIHGANLRYLTAESLVELARRRFERARDAAQELLCAAARYDSAKYTAYARYLLALVSRAAGDASGAEQQLRVALEPLVDRPAPLLAWKIHAELAELELARGASDAAARSLAAAREILSAIAARIERADLRQTFLASPRVRAVLGAETALPQTG